ncbi:putative lipase atg15 [Entomortierella beljakovae]|nr:putative lipase atg15 [Entomortierella beljakovae]
MPRQSSLHYIQLLATFVILLTCFVPFPLTFVQAHPKVVQEFDQSSLVLDTQQIPITQEWSSETKGSSKGNVFIAGQELPSETFTLKHLLHHGGNRFPRLFRRLDLDPIDVRLSEIRGGKSHTHTLKVRATSAIQPRDKSFKGQGFRSFDTSIAPESWTREVIASPDIEDKDTVIQLAKMNYNSYTEIGSPGWYDLEDKWDLNSTFGWEEEGLRGHVFSSTDGNTLVIAVKGTSILGGGATTTRDKINDNLLFSCCCAKVDRTWRAVCDCNTGGYQCDRKCVEESVKTDEVYYNIAMSLFQTVQDMYPESEVWLTGHSLGGGLTSLLGLTFGIPTVTFEAPGERLAAERLHLPGPPAIDWNDFPLFHVGHTADPIFLGVCNGPSSTCYYSGYAMESKCHAGRVCVYDPVKEDNWKVDVRTHRLFDTIEGVLKPKNVPKCAPEKDCVDCELWTYTD